MAATSNSNNSPIDKMNEYKGTAFPSPIIPVLGFSLGLGVPFALVHGKFVTLTSSSTSSAGAADAVLETLQAFGFVSMLFASEFVLGAAARSTSTKASFSPAAAAASSQHPFAVVQSNRIHQNHIESFCILAPAALAAAASSSASSDGIENVAWIKAAVLSWVGFRVIYRIGYCNHGNPFWRIVGTAASMCQSMICFYLWAQNSSSGSGSRSD